MDLYKERFIELLLENKALKVCSNPDRPTKAFRSQ